MISTSIIVIGIVITVKLSEHWAQGYHSDMDASSKDFDDGHCSSHLILRGDLDQLRFDASVHSNFTARLQILLDDLEISL